ncbi:hypothetical protein [Streptomyces sp. NPDC051219]|uniref:hypothetical protein n=1 Tax=Streptomyces sp. NPDC051219 TaxID=3155283 RepID=UPI00341414D0
MTIAGATPVVHGVAERFTHLYATASAMDTPHAHLAADGILQRLDTDRAVYRPADDPEQ